MKLRRRVAVLSAVLSAATAFACDIEGTQHDQKTLGPAISILANSIDGNGGVVPSDGVIQIAFDRYLLPATITRQSYVIADSTNRPLAVSSELKTLYDPVARTVTIAGPGGPGVPWLTPDQSYKLVLLVASDPNSDAGGFRAIDRTPLYRKQKREFVFRAGQPTKQTSIEPAVDFCADVFPIFVAKCSDPSCHGASDSAAAGLVLGSAEGVSLTAKDRVAQGGSTAANSVPLPTPSRFGVNMPIIKPGDPGASWLIYKIELAPTPVVDAGPKPPFLCTPPPDAPPFGSPAPDFTPLPGARTSADDIERAILNDYVLGREMPYPYTPSMYIPPPPSPTDPNATAYFFTPLDFQERQKVRIWIASGAKTKECGGCQAVISPPGPRADAGTPDSAAPDSGGSDAGESDSGPADASDQ